VGTRGIYSRELQERARRRRRLALELDGIVCSVCRSQAALSCLRLRRFLFCGTHVNT
jgi:hypothetical protein